MSLESSVKMQATWLSPPSRLRRCFDIGGLLLAAAAVFIASASAACLDKRAPALAGSGRGNVPIKIIANEQF
jgi:hypothetical protein